MTDDLTLSFTREINASPAAVWRCWTEPELIKQWFAPKPVETTVVEIEPTPGGRFRTVMVVPDYGTMDNAPGCILVADVGARLVWTNALAPQFYPNKLGDGPMDFAFSADIRMAPNGKGGCTYTATVMHATPETCKVHKDMGFYEGWGAATSQLADLAAAI